MHIITVCYMSGQSQDFLYTDADAEIAQQNYVKLQMAMAQYQRFKNDNSEVVSLTSSSGHSVYRIEHLVSVAICEAKQCEGVQAEYAEWNGRLMAARDNAKAGAAVSSPGEPL